MHLERLESRVLLATDLLSTSLAAGRVQSIREAPETETLEVRGFLVESAEFLIANATRTVTGKAATPDQDGTTDRAIRISRTEPIAVTSPGHKLATIDRMRVVSIRLKDASNLAADVLKQRSEPTVLLDKEEVAKTAAETHCECIERDSTRSTTREDAHSQRDAESLEAECESTPRFATVVAPQDPSDREATADQQQEATGAAASEETESTAQSAFKTTAYEPAETPPHLRAAAAGGSMAWNKSSPRSTTPPGQLATIDLAPVSITRFQASPLGEQTVRQYEQLSMTEGAVFAVSVGAPLVRFALAGDVPGAQNGGAAHVSGSSTAYRARSQRRRGNGRPTPLGMVHDLSARSRTEPLAARSAVATELPVPKRCDEHQRPFLPQLVDRFFEESTAETDTQTASRDDRTEDERLDADESLQAGFVQSPAVVAGGSVAAATLAVLAYERVSHRRGDNTADKKTRPANGDTTRVRGDS